MSSARTVAAAAAASLALVAAGCGGSPGSHVAQLGSTAMRGSSSPNTSAASTHGNGLAFSRCMRSHDVSEYPDPDASGRLPKVGLQQLGVSSSQFDAAQTACRDLLPTGGSLHAQEYECMQNSECPQALVQSMLNADRKLARCMRSHGVPSFPGPTTDSHGPVFNITKAGISDAASHTRRFESELDKCARLAGGNAPEAFE